MLNPTDAERQGARNGRPRPEHTRYTGGWIASRIGPVAGSSGMPFEIHPFPGPVGAELRGFDPAATPTEAVVERLRRALAERGLLMLRGVDLDEPAQLRLTDTFGRSVPHLVPTAISARPRAGARPEAAYLGHDPGVEESEFKLGSGALPFHADLQYTARPLLYTILHAIEVPSEGGATHFAGCTAAWRALPIRLRLQLRFRVAEHRFLDRNPVLHPVSCRHPLSGGRSLFVSPAVTQRILAMGRKRSRQLLDGLFRHMTQPRFVWTHRWRPGDLLIWDNLCTVHARDPFDPGQRRMMRRTQPDVPAIPGAHAAE